MTEALRQAHIALTAIFTHPTLELSDFMRGKLADAIAAAESELSQPAREGLTDAQIGRHTLTASDCPPNSQVILVSSLHRLLGIGTAGAQEGGR
jgi:hypothetical protein